MKKKVVPFILIFSIATMSLASCGGDTKTANNTTAPSNSSAPAPSESTKPAEPVELEIHFHANNKYTLADESGNILPVFQLAAEKTNVKIVNTANPVAQSSSQEFQLQATEKFPSDIYGGTSIKEGVFTYGTQGAFLPLNDLIDEHAPNIKKLLEENPDIRKALTASDGNIYMMNYFPDGDTARTYFIRKDWLDALGLPMPSNFEEL